MLIGEINQRQDGLINGQPPPPSDIQEPDIINKVEDS